jgi:hypothetical protein
MKTKSDILMLAGLLNADRKKTFTFYEITDKAELEKAFHFRYEVYLKCSNRVFLKENIHHVDLEIYDLHSKHFGLYTSRQELTGYFRVVMDRKELYNFQVFEIGMKYGLFSLQEHSYECYRYSTEPEYPFLSYPNLPEEIKSYFQSIKNKSEGVVEASRLMIKEEYRSIRTAMLFIECTLAQYMMICLGHKHGVLSCVKEHGSLYKRYGFQIIGASDGYEIYNRKAITMSLSLSSSSIPSLFFSRIEGMAAEYCVTGKIERTL